MSHSTGEARVRLRYAMRCAWRRFTALETKYDRRILVALALGGAYVAAWMVMRG